MFGLRLLTNQPRTDCFLFRSEREGCPGYSGQAAIVIPGVIVAEMVTLRTYTPFTADGFND